MKRLALVALAACGGHADGKPKDAAPAGLTLHCTPPAVGLRIVEEDTQTSKQTLTGGSDAQSTDDELDHVLTHTDVLAVSGDAVTKIRVQYDANETDRAKSPLSGHTYVVAVGLPATHDDGSGVTGEEQAALDEDHADLGKPPQLSRVLCAHTWIPNQRVELAGDELAALGPSGWDSQPTAGSFTFMGGVDEATFASDVTLVLDAATGHGETHMRGYLRILVDGVRPLEITDDGDMSGVFSGMKVVGQINGHITYSYSQ